MARRSEHTQSEIKEMVIQAAETIIREDGLSKLKVRSIAMEIGYTVGSIYMVFESMGDLILHLKARTLEDIALLMEQVPSHLPAEMCLVNLSKAYLNFAKLHFNRWQLLFDREHTGDVVLPEAYKQKVMQLFVPVQLQFQRLAPNATTEQIQQAAHALWGGVHGICWLSLGGSMDVVGADDVETTVVLLVEQFVRGWTAAQS